MIMKNEITFTNLKLEGNELIIREGKASDPVVPQKVEITGRFDAPLKWIMKRLATPYYAPMVELSHVAVDRERRVILLVTNDKVPTADEICGILCLHPDFKKFNINSGQQISAHDLAEFIKMNRSCFKDKATAMSLVTDLRKFTAKVNKKLEAFKDDRANYSIKKAQIIDSNLPESFQIVVPIFQGYPKETITVEININADTLACSLISPEANDYVHDFSDRFIDEQLKKIEDTVPGLAIIEI
jgi:hypothetical protein